MGTGSGTRRAGLDRTARRLALTLAAAVAALACVAAGADAPPAARADAPFMPLHEPLERYEQAEVVIESGTRRHAFRTWIADTPERREQGLMWIRSLPADRAMLFVFERPQPVSFWMKNTYVSLDLLFIAPDGRIIRIAPNAEPLSLRSIDSMGVVRGVFEVRGGTAKRLGIEPGDRLRHPAFASR